MTGREPPETRNTDAPPEKLGMVNKTGNLVREFFSSPTRTTEAIAAGIMSQLEIVHDRQLFPEKWERLGFPKGDPGTWMVPDNPPAVKWAFDNIGDIWEISVGHGVLRLCLFAVNGMLRQPETVGLQKEMLQNETVSKMTSKVVGEERAGELAEGAEIQISDDACFWTSLATTFTIKAIHSMGWISLFGIHDHMDEPVPGMIFGQVVAATALAASHYAAKNGESVKELFNRVGGIVVEKAKSLDKQLQDFSKTGPDKLETKLEQGMESEQLRILTAMYYLEASLDEFMLSLTPEAIVNKMLNSRVALAINKLKAGHDKDEKDE